MCANIHESWTIVFIGCNYNKEPDTSWRCHLSIRGEVKVVTQKILVAQSVNAVGMFDLLANKQYTERDKAPPPLRNYTNGVTKQHCAKREWKMQLERGGCHFSTHWQTYVQLKLLSDNMYIITYCNYKLITGEYRVQICLYKFEPDIHLF